MKEIIIKANKIAKNISADRGEVKLSLHEGVDFYVYIPIERDTMIAPVFGDILNHDGFEKIWLESRYLNFRVDMSELLLAGSKKIHQKANAKLDENKDMPGIIYYAFKRIEMFRSFSDICACSTNVDIEGEKAFYYGIKLDSIRDIFFKALTLELWKEEKKEQRCIELLEIFLILLDSLPMIQIIKNEHMESAIDLVNVVLIEYLEGA